MGRRWLLGLVLLCSGAAGQSLAVGKILVATPKLNDPDFSKSVVLLIYANPKAAIGLIVNRPLDRKANQWAGGPIPLGTNALIRTTAGPAQSQRILPDVFLHSGSDPATLRGEFRVYKGTCGWTTPQLQDELRRGDWRVLPGKSEILFDANPETLWQRLEAGR